MTMPPDINSPYKVIALRFGRSLKADQVEAFLTGIESSGGHWRIALEVHATFQRIAHRLRVSPLRLSVITRQLRAHVPSSRLELLDQDVNAADYGFKVAEEFTLVGELGLLADRDAETVSTALLAALSLTRKSERVVLQWVLAPAQTNNLLAQFSTDLRSILHPQLTHPDDKGMREKRESTGFMAVLRIGADAADADRARNLIHHVAAPLGIVRTHATMFKSTGSGAGPAQRLFNADVAGFSSGGRLIADELIGLLAWPVGEPQIPGLSTGTSRQLPAPPEVATKGLLIGVSTMPGSKRPLCLTKTGIRQHLGITAPTGTGKSTLEGGIALQAIEAGIGLVVVDWKGDLIANLIDRIPAERVNDVIVFDATAKRSVVGLPNPLGGDPDDRDLLIDGLVGWLGRSWESSWGPRTGTVVQVGLFTLARAGGYSLIDLPELLVNPAMRQRVLAKVTDFSGLGNFWSSFEAMSEGERAQVIAPTLNRTRPWLVRRNVRHVLGQPESRFTLDEVLAGKILLVNLGAGQLGDATAGLLGSLLVGQLSSAIMRRSRIPETKRRTALVMLDEFQFITGMSGDFEQTLAMARGLGVGFVVAHQYLDQLDTGLRRAVLANVRSRVAFQLAAKDSESIAKEFGSPVKGSDLMHLPAFEAIARLATPRGVSGPISLRTEPLPPSLGTAKAVLKASEANYGRRREDIDRAITERHNQSQGGGAVGRKPRPQPTDGGES